MSTKCASPDRSGQRCKPNTPQFLNIGAGLPTYSSNLDLLHDMRRLAGLIYSDVVLFPLPPTTGVRPRLAVQLHSAMKQYANAETMRSNFEYMAMKAAITISW